MAVAVVQKKQTAGAAAHGTITITAATKDNWLLALVSQNGSTAAPKGKDATSGETGWTALEGAGEHAIFGASANSLWLLKKRAVGGETELNPTPGAGGTFQGISYIEVEGLGATPTVETVVKVDNQAGVKTITSGALTTADSTDLILAGIGPALATGTVEAWSASAGSAPTNVETLTTRCIGGYLVPGVTLSAVTFTAKWTNSVNAGMLVFAIKPTSGETKVVTALVHGAGAASVTALKLATPTAIVTGAGLASVVSLKVARTVASVTGAGSSSVKASKTAITNALVTGAGNATVTITPAGEVKVVTALVHGAGRASVLASRVAITTAKVTGAGNATVVSRKVAVTIGAVTGGGLVTVKTSRTGVVTARVTGAGRANVTVGRIALVVASVTGAGNATVTLTTGSIEPCLMKILNGKAAHHLIVNGKAAHHEIVNRKAARQVLVNL